MGIAIAIAAILAVAVVTVLLTANRRRATTGSLSRETRRRDASDAAATAADDAAADTEARERADATRVATEGAGLPAVPEPATVATWEPVDEEELGVTRRQFLNRGILATLGFSVAAFGAACLGFIWPIGGGGFGGSVTAGRLSTILADIRAKRAPFYVPEARAYVNVYPTDAVGAARQQGYPDAIIPNLEAGVIVQYQKCPHLGCRVPWCQTSQWFECPCHGSKYNRVGEKRDGPAPRGMTMFRADTADDTLVIDTSIEYPGMKIGTDTTGQKPEGPSCV